MAEDKMQLNLEFVRKNLPSLLATYPEKYILVHDQKVVGSFDTYESAAEQGVVNYGIDGSFLVHLVTESSPVNFVTLAVL